MQKVKYKISGMHSISDATQIENKLKKQPGVEIVKANPESGKVVIVFDEIKTKSSQFTELISDLGDFQVKETDIAKETPEVDAKIVKKINNQKYERTSSGIYYGNTFAIGIFIGISLMSLLLNIILLTLLFKN